MKTLLLFFFALPAAAAYPARDLVVPVAGRATGPDGRTYLTALRITNTSDRQADIAMTFHPAAQKLSPISSSLQLAAGETRVLDPYDPGVDAGIGWIRMQSSRDLIVNSTIYSRLGNTRTSGTSVAAIPAKLAIGNGDATTLQGLAPTASRYKLYFDEVGGKPLEVWVKLLDARGAEVGRTHVYIDGWQQVVKDVAAPPAATVVRVEGMHGRGRVIVTGSAIANGATDAASFEMSFAPSRDRISNAEAAAYFACAIGILAAIVVRRR